MGRVGRGTSVRALFVGCIFGGLLARVKAAATAEARQRSPVDACPSAAAVSSDHLRSGDNGQAESWCCHASSCHASSCHASSAAAAARPSCPCPSCCERVRTGSKACVCASSEHGLAGRRPDRLATPLSRQIMRFIRMLRTYPRCDPSAPLHVRPGAHLTRRP